MLVHLDPRLFLAFRAAFVELPSGRFPLPRHERSLRHAVTLYERYAGTQREHSAVCVLAAARAQYIALLN